MENTGEGSIVRSRFSLGFPKEAAAEEEHDHRFHKLHRKETCREMMKGRLLRALNYIAEALAEG
jgi:hypothetical protein